MKHYTSIEQSKRLIGILREGSADLVYIENKKVPVVIEKIPQPYHNIPCWSTGALLQMLPHGKDDSPITLERGGMFLAGHTLTAGT